MLIESFPPRRRSFGVCNTGILSGEQVNITRVESRSGSSFDRPAWINITLELADLTQLERIMARIRTLPYVREVSRSARL
jgi:(p)ppGpp synthase/HD superfamily hydrolase